MACDVLSTRSAACELVHVRRFVSVSVLAVCPPFVTNDENHDAVMLSSGDWTRKRRSFNAIRFVSDRPFS